MVVGIYCRLWPVNVKTSNNSVPFLPWNSPRFRLRTASEVWPRSSAWVPKSAAPSAAWACHGHLKILKAAGMSNDRWLHWISMEFKWFQHISTIDAQYNSYLWIATVNGLFLSKPFPMYYAPILLDSLAPAPCKALFAARLEAADNMHRWASNPLEPNGQNNWMAYGFPGAITTCCKRKRQTFSPFSKCVFHKDNDDLVFCVCYFFAIWADPSQVLLKYKWHSPTVLVLACYKTCEIMRDPNFVRPNF